MHIKVIFTWRDDLLGKLARRFGMTWSHVGLLYGSDQNWHVFEASMWGVRNLSVDDFIANWKEYKTLKPVQDIPLHIIMSMIAFAHGNVGKPYGFLMLVKMMIEFLKDRFFMRTLTYPSHVCSSLVDECFNFIGIDLVPGKGRFVFPDDLYLSKKLEPDRLQ